MLKGDAKANDGNYDSYGLVTKVTNYLVTDLGKMTDVYKVALFVPNGTYGAYAEYSVDGKTYLPFGMTAAGTGYDPATGLVVLADSGVITARYLRFSFIGSETENLDVSEIKVYTSALAGDMNDDGEVNVSDVTALLNYLSDSNNVPEAGAVVADVNRDGRVNISDVTALLNMLAGTK